MVSVGRQKSPTQKEQKRFPGIGMRYIKKAFGLIKATIVQDVVLAYPDYSENFEVYTDASATQLGAVITKKNRPLAFFIRNLPDTQKQYSVTKIELLAIVEKLNEFKGMLWGQKL